MLQRYEIIVFIMKKDHCIANSMNQNKGSKDCLLVSDSTPTVNMKNRPTILQQRYAPLCLTFPLDCYFLSRMRHLSRKKLLLFFVNFCRFEHLFIQIDLKQQGNICACLVHLLLWGSFPFFFNKSSHNLIQST